MTSAAVEDGDPLTAKQRRILAHLAQASESQTYFKSRQIGDELGLSAKEVGANMRRIETHAPGLRIEKWGYSSGTTWKITQE